MTDAYLKIIFCSFRVPLYNIFKMDNMQYNIDEGEIEIMIEFSYLEKELGKKVCSYELINNGENQGETLTGTFEIYNGKNIGYCFVDDEGIALELLFINKNCDIEKLVKEGFYITVNNSNKKIKAFGNKINTLDRANLLLINCTSKEKIILGDKIISTKKIIKKIMDDSSLDGHQICFLDDELTDFSERKIEKIYELNFGEIFNEHNNSYNEVYESLIKLLEQKIESEKIKEHLNNLYNRIKDPEQIIKKKYTYTNKILDKELNNKYYFDFIFKATFLNLIKKFLEDSTIIDINKIKIIHKNMENIKNIINNDNNLKTYEKILLLIELNSSRFNLLKNNNIKYFHKKSIDKNSPLYMAFEFLNELVDNLDYESNLYLPLLSIDSGIFQYIYNVDSFKQYNVSIYGFNMNPLESIKEHLRGVMPNLILYSNVKDDNDSDINSYTGLININIYEFKNTEINKSIKNINERKHFAFIITKCLLHEIFGHKKSLISKFGTKFLSPITFKNSIGNLKYLTEANDISQFSDFKDVVGTLALENCCGDSGYYLEYYFGEIGNYSITSILDNIKNQTNLGALMNSELWCKKLDILKNYVYYKYLSIQYQIKVNEDLSLEAQINYLKNELSKFGSFVDIDEESKINNDISRIQINSEEKFIKGKKSNSMVDNGFLQTDKSKVKQQLYPKEKNKIKYCFFSEFVYKK